MAGTANATIIDEFARHVRNYFGYLESDYGFTACPLRTRDIDEPRDASVSIRYKSDVVSIHIGLALTGRGIGVNFKNEHWCDVPSGQRVRWISLDSIIAFQTKRTAKTLLHELTSSRRKYWPEGWLLKNMQLAILTLASQVRQYATDIISGDVSTFPAIAASDRGRNAT